MPKKGKTWRPPSGSRGAQARRAQSSGPTQRQAQGSAQGAAQGSTQAPPRGTRTEPEIDEAAQPEERTERAERAERVERAERAKRSDASVQRPPAVTPNRQARKEEARRQREMLRRKAARRRLWGRVLGIAGAAVVVAGVVTGVLLLGGGKTQIPQGLKGIQTDTEPWPPELTNLQQRLNQIHIGFLGQEQLAFHIHQHLDLFVNGSPVTVPQNIGIISGTGLAFIHTHDTSGVIHVESPTVRQYTLGNFFDVWGVLFTKDQLGAYQNSGDDTLRVYVNGKLFQGNPRNVPLKNFDEIVVAYGTPQQLPSPIPKIYGPFEQAKKAERKARQQANATPTPSGSAATPSPSST
jgi:hypothetical protein